MERFAFKIDSALKANLYKICRLCGIDNPSKVPILPDANDVLDLDEPTLCQKVFELVGFKVTQNDKMPQTICSLCVDKINDFYEFREMCIATNKQTRKLLGLKKEEARVPDVKPVVKSESSTACGPAKRGRKRKTEETLTVGACTRANKLDIALGSVKSEQISCRKKLRLNQQQLATSKSEVKEETKATIKKVRKVSCSVCGQCFNNKEQVEEHKVSKHVPTIERYSCNACNQSHHNPSDIKAHQLWHKLSKTPYLCPLCNASVANNYAYTRHMREHSMVTPIELQVLDRECPLCKKTFLTNFFYNTHPCARRTRKCGGCSRLLSTDLAYMRHAPHCAKIYLNHSNHIMPEEANQEAQVRIKNENDLDMEDNAVSSALLKQGDFQPVVVLKRLGSPILRASTTSNSLGRCTDRVSTKKYLKRVDQLLKSTISTLVSIKHEPEVHIDDTEPQLAAEGEGESGLDDEPPACEDFHANVADDETDEDVASACASTGILDPGQSVKQEPIDEAYESPPALSSEQFHIKQEPLKLKLKITKNHGQLNSSIVDDDNELKSRNARKKKKRKHKERNKDSNTGGKTAPPNIATEESPTENTVESAGCRNVSIKQERLDENYACDFMAQAEFQGQATVMTSIPMLQLERSLTEEANEELEDVKPNRSELDRLMQITHVASGVAMADEAMPPARAVEAVFQAPSRKAVRYPKRQVATARKSTGGERVSKKELSELHLTWASVEYLPKIVSVEGGSSVPFNALAIKPEPVNRGYADEDHWTTEQRDSGKYDEINHNENVEGDSLDRNIVVIKQEMDLHISDLNVSHSEAENTPGLPAREEDAGDENDEEDHKDDDGSESSADEPEEEDNEELDQEQCIYREIELLPLINQPAIPSQSEPEEVSMEPQHKLKAAEEQEEVQTTKTQLETVTAEREVKGRESSAGSEEGKATEPALKSSCTLLDKGGTEREEERLMGPSANSFNLVITSVRSQVVEPPDDKQEPVEEIPKELSPQVSLKKPEAEGENQNTCTAMTINAPKENESLAQPVPCSSSDYHCPEEQQNVLNHELSASEQMPETVVSTEQEQEFELESEPPAASPAAGLEGSADEETENRINEEQQQLHLEQVQQAPQSIRLVVLDDSNINEIAENNNNANIERELNDDANVAQEDLI